MMDFVQAICNFQDTNRLTDKEIAGMLKLHRITWHRIRRGRRYGRKFLEGARSAFPDIFLSSNATLSSNEGQP